MNKKDISKYFSELGKKGGKKRVEKAKRDEKGKFIKAQLFYPEQLILIATGYCTLCFYDKVQYQKRLF